MSIPNSGVALGLETFLDVYPPEQGAEGVEDEVAGREVLVVVRLLLDQVEKGEVDARVGLDPLAPQAFHATAQQADHCVTVTALVWSRTSGHLFSILSAFYIVHCRTGYLEHTTQGLLTLFLRQACH